MFLLIVRFFLWIISVCLTGIIAPCDAIATRVDGWKGSVDAFSESLRWPPAYRDNVKIVRR